MGWLSTSAETILVANKALVHGIAKVPARSFCPTLSAAMPAFNSASRSICSDMASDCSATLISGTAFFALGTNQP